MSTRSNKETGALAVNYASAGIQDALPTKARYTVPVDRDKEYLFKLTRLSGLKKTELDQVYDPFLMNTYLKTSPDRKTIRRIAVESYLNMRVSPHLPPNSLIRGEKWAELARMYPKFTSRQLLEHIVNLPPREQGSIFHLFDPEFYYYKYSDIIGQRSPVEFFLSDGIFLDHSTNPFLVKGQFWQGWLRENIRLEGAASPTLMADRWKYLGARIEGIWPVYGSRHNIADINTFQVLDDYLASAAYVTWRHIFQTDASFDVDYYRATQQDLRDLSDEEAQLHFKEFGSKEGRAGSMMALANNPQCAFNALDADFEWENYRYSNQDLTHLDNQAACIAHFVCNGHREARLSSAIIPVYDLENYKNYCAFDSHAAALAGKQKQGCAIRLYFHIFYEDLVPQYINILRAAHLNGAKIYINLACGVLRPESIILLAEFSPLYVVSPNRGRDIGGYYYISKLHPPEDSDIVAVVHTKKSPHVSPQYRRKWVDSLIYAIGTDKDKFRQNVDAMCNDPTLMIIGSVSQLFVDNGGGNKAKLVQLLARLGLDNSTMLFPFVAGTMAIYRGAVLNRLFEVVAPVDLDEGRPDDLKYNVDGQFAHALERAMGILGHTLGRVVWR